MINRQGNHRMFEQILIGSVLTTVMVFSLKDSFGFGASPKMLLLLRDVSQSSIGDTRWNDTVAAVCKGVAEASKGSQFAVISYADYSEPDTPRTVKDTLLAARRCNAVDFKPSGTGTNPKAAVEDALALVDQPNQGNVPYVVVTIHADENGSRVRITRRDLTDAVGRLAQAIERKHGRLIILTRSYQQLKADLWNTVAREKLSPSTVQFCGIDAQKPHATVQCVKSAL